MRLGRGGIHFKRTTNQTPTLGQWKKFSQNLTNLSKLGGVIRCCFETNFNMLKFIIIGGVILVGLVVVIMIAAVLQPARFRVERSAAIAAPPGVLFDQVNDHKKFQKWNPWAKLDPESKTSYSGPDSGVGAVASWTGKKVGTGSATIIESVPGEFVRQRMDWLKPLEGTSTVDFTFKPDGGKTLVTWAMYGENKFMGKLLSLFLSCEKMCGPQFEKGLADLDQLVTSSGTFSSQNQP